MQYMENLRYHYSQHHPVLNSDRSAPPTEDRRELRLYLQSLFRPYVSALHEYRNNGGCIILSTHYTLQEVIWNSAIDQPANTQFILNTETMNIMQKRLGLAVLNKSNIWVGIGYKKRQRLIRLKSGLLIWMPSPSVMSAV